MNKKRTYFILLFAFFLLFPISSLHNNDPYSSNFSLEKITLLFDFSIKNISLIISFQEKKAFFPTEFSTVQLNNGNAFFIFSKKLLLDEKFLSKKDLLKSKISGLIKADIFHHKRDKFLILKLHNPRKLMKKSNFSAKFNLEKHFLPFKNLPCTSQQEKNEKKYILLGFYIPILALISIISSIFTNLNKLLTKKKQKPQTPSQNTPVSTQNSIISNLLSEFQKFTYMELNVATNGFHKSEILGIGLYASVYKAKFPESNTIYAVKRFNQNISSKTSFQIEVTAIYRIRHDKILELRKWCDDNPNEPMLVYDYMPNKSLNEALRNRNQILIWPHRYKIAVGVAEAIVYLHEECSPMIIHGDIKEGNVMLDSDFNPKLGDFGLAMSFPPYEIWRKRTEQDPPECELNAIVNEKFDVYLYGSMVLGICCCQGKGNLNLFCQFLKNMKLEGKILDVVDIRLDGKYDEEEMLRLLNVGLLCLEEDFQKRPSMKEVLQILKSEESDFFSGVGTSI